MKTLLCFVTMFACFGAQAQIANSDFENWYVDSNGKSRLTGWDHLVKYDFANSGFFGTYKAAPGEHGQYALTISRWYSYTWDVVRQFSPVAFKPVSLSGYYKYTDNDLTSGRAKDTALVEIYLTKWNAASSRRDTVGTGTKELGLCIAFAAFSCPLSYSGSTNPDSILIRLLPSKFKNSVGACADSGWCSFLTIDNLSLDQSTGVYAPPLSHIAVFPNPVTNTLFIDLKQSGLCNLNVTDVLGKSIWKSGLHKS